MPPSALPPFLVFLHQSDLRPDGSFRPDARLTVTPALRTSGLLLAIPAEELRTLLLVMTFLHPNGHVQPSLSELADALRLPQGMARIRLRRLERFQWQDRPLLHELRRESGLHAFVPSTGILGAENVVKSAPDTHPPIRAAGRDAVVAHSRATYARPRKEVEEEMARLNGWKPINAPSGDPEADALVGRLVAAGLGRWEASGLIESFGKERVRRQLDWLPYRNARDPVRFLAVAVRDDYDPPKGMPTVETNSPEAHE
jgi:hypothetical protein